MTDPTYTVELTCRHLARHTQPAWSDWLGVTVHCEVCKQDRVIVDVRWPHD